MYMSVNIYIHFSHTAYTKNKLTYKIKQVSKILKYNYNLIIFKKKKKMTFENYLGVYV